MSARRFIESEMLEAVDARTRELAASEAERYRLEAANLKLGVELREAEISASTKAAQAQDLADTADSLRKDVQQLHALLASARSREALP